jgi:hypothetical protein
MARASKTPVTYWMEMSVLHFFRWIDSANEVEKEDEAQRKQLGGKK